MCRAAADACAEGDKVGVGGWFIRKHSAPQCAPYCLHHDSDTSPRESDMLPARVFDELLAVPEADEAAKWAQAHICAARGGAHAKAHQGGTVGCPPSGGL
ncbi:unnamed protein product [Effrenium voratum]|uniref:Uncharacterized protein n=1 Tax=Effrenium voratum TaxID=2562239 RepID=A0AA36MP02_9DINO|nr:unnamed protein product [Effrenium voratum]